MKKLLLVPVLLFAIAGFSQTRKSPHDTVSTKDVTITYGRPSMHGRVIFGELIKYGQVWRLGADEATTISLASDSKIGETTIPAGRYTLFAMVNENEWTFIFNSVLGQWGSFSYEKNKDKDVAQVTVPVSKSAEPVEQFTIRVDSDNSITVEWEQIKIQLPIKAKE